MAILKSPPPPQLADIIDIFGFDAETGDFAIFFKRPYRVTRIVGEAGLELIGTDLPVGRLLKVFIRPMDQAPTDNKEVV